MKYPAHIYAKALVEVLTAFKGSKGEGEALAQNFLELVKRNGDEGHLRQIVEEASRFARGKSGVRKVTIASARELSVAQTKTLERFVQPGDVVERRIEPGLIAGIKIILDDELQFDGSLKSKLNSVLGSA